MKQVIRLNEKDIRRMVMEAINELDITNDQFGDMARKAHQKAGEYRDNGDYDKYDQKMRQAKDFLTKYGNGEEYHSPKGKPSSKKATSNNEPGLNQQVMKLLQDTRTQNASNALTRTIKDKEQYEKEKAKTGERSVDDGYTDGMIEELCYRWKEECQHLLNDENAQPEDFKTPAYYALVRATCQQVDINNKNMNSGINYTRSFIDPLYNKIKNLLISDVNYETDTSMDQNGTFITPQEWEDLPEMEQQMWKLVGAKNSDNRGMYKKMRYKNGMENPFNFDDSMKKTIYHYLSDAIQCVMTTGQGDAISVLDYAKTILNKKDPFYALKNHLATMCEHYLRDVLPGLVEFRQNVVSASEDGSSEGAYRIDQGLTSQKGPNSKKRGATALTKMKAVFEWIGYKNVASSITPEEYSQLTKVKPQEAAEYTIIEYDEPNTDDNGSIVNKKAVTMGKDKNNNKIVTAYIEPEMHFNGIADGLNDQSVTNICRFIFDNFDSLINTNWVNNNVSNYDENGNLVVSPLQWKDSDGKTHTSTEKVTSHKSDTQFLKCFKDYVNQACIDAGVMSGKQAKSFWSIFGKVMKELQDNAGDFVQAQSDRKAFEARQRKMISRIVNETIKRHLRML